MAEAEDPSTPELVAAARAGDPRALDDLVARHLPLVYSLVGRALEGHPDVDDVVQETMLRVVDRLDAVRDPATFRSWLVTITVGQIRERTRERRNRASRNLFLDDAKDAVSPCADFAELTVLQLDLSGERRRVATATAWLDPQDRELLALWWLEETGELSRAELAHALGLPLTHAAVRVQRMKAHLEVARAVVGALGLRPHCRDLDVLLRGWDEQPAPLWRKRIARHLRACPPCWSASSALVPAERLLN